MLKFGGKVISMTEAALDGWGVSKRSGEARDAGGITVDGVKFDADKYYRTTGNTTSTVHTLWRTMFMMLPIYVFVK